jgi:hypothetical protein
MFRGGFSFLRRPLRGGHPCYGKSRTKNPKGREFCC